MLKKKCYMWAALHEHARCYLHNYDRSFLSPTNPTLSKSHVTLRGLQEGKKKAKNVFMTYSLKPGKCVERETNGVISSLQDDMSGPDGWLGSCNEGHAWCHAWVCGAAVACTRSWATGQRDAFPTAGHQHLCSERKLFTRRHFLRKKDRHPAIWCRQSEQRSQQRNFYCIVSCDVPLHTNRIPPKHTTPALQKLIPTVSWNKCITKWKHAFREC